MGAFDLRGLLETMARRDRGRTEADIQSDLKMFLTLAPFSLEEHQLSEITLEQQAGGGQRTDVEAGCTVFEVKKDLSVGKVLQDAVDQLTGYVSRRSAEMGSRYVGVLTDGREWRLYRLHGGALEPVSDFTVNPQAPDLDGLVVWLEAVLATTDRIKPVPDEVRRKLGATSPAFKLDLADLKELYRAASKDSEVLLQRELWARLLESALGTNFADDDDLFVAHTYLVLVAELVAHAVAGIDLADGRFDVGAVLSGEMFLKLGIGGVVESDFFDWPGRTDLGRSFVRNLARSLARFDWSDIEHDVLKTLYESVIDEPTRHRLGEYYTPDWLAERIVLEVVNDPLAQRVLDPSCGSGTFLFWSIRHYLQAAEVAGMSNADSVAGVAAHVYGIDLHPVAVTLARVTYLLALGRDRLQDRRAFSVPVYLGDSIQLGDESSILAGGGIAVRTTEGELWEQTIQFPGPVVEDAAAFDGLLSELADRSRRFTAKGDHPRITAVLDRYAVSDEDRDTVERGRVQPVNATRRQCSGRGRWPSGGCVGAWC